MKLLPNGRVRVFDTFAYGGRGAWKEVLPVDAREMLKAGTVTLEDESEEPAPAPKKKAKAKASGKKAKANGKKNGNGKKKVEPTNYDVSKNRLKTLCKEREIEFGDQTKGELVELLEAADAAAE